MEKVYHSSISSKAKRPKKLNAHFDKTWFQAKLIITIHLVATEMTYLRSVITTEPPCSQKLNDKFTACPYRFLSVGEKVQQGANFATTLTPAEQNMHFTLPRVHTETFLPTWSTYSWSWRKTRDLTMCREVPSVMHQFPLYLIIRKQPSSTCCKSLQLIGGRKTANATDEKTRDERRWRWFDAQFAQFSF